MKTRLATEFSEIETGFGPPISDRLTALIDTFAISLATTKQDDCLAGNVEGSS
jgi:hypothetical protein